MANPEIFTGPFSIGSKYPGFNKLNQLGQFAQEVGATVWDLSTIHNLAIYKDEATINLRAGFSGTVNINEVTLLEDGIITGQGTTALDGLLFELRMDFLATGEPKAIQEIGGLAIGENTRTDVIEIRAYDLRAKSFDKISYEGLERYLKASMIKGGGTGTSLATARTKQVSKNARSQVNRRK